MKKTLLILPLFLMALSFSGCSREKTNGKAAGNGIEYPSVPRMELPAEENAYPVWTNAMLFAKPSPDEVDLGRAILAASALKTNLAFFANAPSRGRKPCADLLNSNMTKVADCPLLLEWLKSRKEVLEQIDKGLALGKIQYPQMTISNAVDILHISGFMALYKLKKINGRYLAECGDYSGAINQFCDVYKMADMMATGHGTGVACMIRNGLIAGGYVSGLEWLSRKNAQNASLLREILGRMAVPDPFDPVLAQSFQSEASLFTLQTFEHIAEQKIYCNKIYPTRLYSLLDPEETATLSQAIFTQAATNACRPWVERNCTLINELNRRLECANVPKIVKTTLVQSILFATVHANKKETIELWKPLKISARREPNVFGLLLLKSSMDFTESAHQRSVKLRCEINLLRASIALMIIKAETGSYPDTLDEAVKKGILSELPVDFFSGNPLLYSSERRCLWSIGSDEVDNGGDKKADIFFQLP
jgi:hypothetical protein